MSVNGNKCCTLCGLSEGFEDGCKFSIEKEKNEIEKEKIDVEKEKIDVENKKIDIEKEKIDVENKKIDVENMKVILGTVLISLVFFIFFLFIAVVYFGFDGLKMQFSRVVDECSKGGLFAGISHLFRRR